MDIEFLAEELHKTYRAALKAFTGRYHDHGFGHCNKKEYFRRRAQVILDEVDRREYANDHDTWFLEYLRKTEVPAKPTEDVAEYDALIDRWTGPCEGFSRMIFYYAQKVTLEALGLAALRASR